VGIFSIFQDTIVVDTTKKPLVDAGFVHPDDRPIVDHITACRSAYTFIAGGACLAWYQNRPVTTDIDVYFFSDLQLDRFKQYFENSDFFQNHASYMIKATTGNAFTYSVCMNESGKYWNVQLIKKNFYRTLEAVLDNFDITVCKIGYDGEQVLTRSTFVDDVATRTLRFDNINPMSHKRLVKYMAYGYEPAPGIIAELVASENIDWETKGTDHYA
jgi:hypothetical protein